MVNIFVLALFTYKYLSVCSILNSSGFFVAT